MTQGTMELIQTVTVGAGGAANITFSNIPATYNDLLIKTSIRNSGTTLNSFPSALLKFNTSSANFSARLLFGDGATTSSSTNTTGYFATINNNNTTSSTSNTFTSVDIYIPNYTGSTNKSFSAESVTETNGTTAYAVLTAGLWSQTSAITSIEIYPSADQFVQHSTATLYGITRVPAGAKATGGVIYDDSSYWYHVFTSSGTFTPSQSITADVLVVAGGGSGGLSAPGGGGAGGLLAHTNQSLTATNYTITVGGGGAGVTVSGAGTKGSNSQFGSLTASEGGGAGRSTSGGGVPNGGSGGGGAEFGGNSTGGTATAGQGFNGGNNNGGGGGAGQAGATGYGASGTGIGGDGVSTYSSWGLATNTGENISGTVWYAGGGGGYGAGPTQANGGKGGGRRGNQGAAPAATGGGSGADGQANGGSGIVIVRYAK